MKLINRVLALSNLVGLAEMAYIEADNELNIITWNNGASKLFSCCENEAMSESLDHLVPIDKNSLINAKKPEKITKSIVDENGYKIWYDLYISPIISIKGDKEGVSILVKDISTEIRKDTDLVEYRKQLQHIYEFAPIGIFKADLDGNLNLANSEFAWILGYDSSVFIKKKNPKNFYDLFVDSGRAKEFQYYLQESESVNRFRCQLMKNDGSSLWTMSYAKSSYNDQGRISGFNGFSIDITETIKAENALKKANEKLTLLSVQDGLTKIPNRRKFDETLANEWLRHKRNQTELAVIISDIDYFKFYNDTYGHQKGDTCLIKVAASIKNTVKRPGDLAARYGGEEFSVVLPQTDARGTLKVSQNINNSIKKLNIPHKSSETADHITLSVGASSTIPDNNNSFEELLQKADEALYEAKEAGRDRVFYKPV